MPLNWIDTTNLSFNALLLLEQAQISWMPGNVPEAELDIALQANPAVDWFLRHKHPAIIPWLEQIHSSHPSAHQPKEDDIRQAELQVLSAINDWLVYALDPSIYDAQPFMGWDSNELRNMADFNGKTVLDIGSGTGRLALVAAEQAGVVFAVEPVGNLRRYIQGKAQAQGFGNVYTIDGVITAIPFPDGFADITMTGHVYGDQPEAEYLEMKRVTKPGGMVLLCPGTSLNEIAAHEYLLSQDFHWAEFEEPTEGMKRKYWKTKE